MDLHTPRILAIIPTLNDDPTETINSLLQQSVKPSKILIAVGSWQLCKKLISNKTEGLGVFYVKPNFTEPLGKRVAAALNFLLSKVNWRDYDYLLKWMLIPYCRTASSRRI